MARVIINSDDFGYSPDVNSAIVMAFRKGLITSTSMLVNFQDGYADAIRIIKDKLINTNAIGIHLNLTEGPPLTDAIKECARFCDGKVFHGRARKNMLFKLSKPEKRAVERELSAQFEKIGSLGFAPSHIDSHHHIHTEWGVMCILKDIARAHGVQKIRLSRNVGGGIGLVKIMYKSMFNRYLNSCGFTTTRFMGDIDDYLFTGSLPCEDAEIMVHALWKDNSLVDLDGSCLKSKLDKLSICHTKAVNYTDLIFGQYPR